MSTPHRRLASLFALSSALWALQGTALAADAPLDTHAGLLKTVRGEVQLQDAQGTSTRARVGDAVNAQQRIVTGAQSGASVVLRDGTTFVIGPRSSFDLQTFRYDSGTHDGSVVARLAPLTRAAAGPFLERRFRQIAKKTVVKAYDAARARD